MHSGAHRRSEPWSAKNQWLYLNLSEPWYGLLKVRAHFYYSLDQTDTWTNQGTKYTMDYIVNRKYTAFSSLDEPRGQLE